MNSNLTTDKILDAIKEMMSDKDTNDQDLPRDVIELTNPVNIEPNEIKPDILELTDPISDEVNNKQVNKSDEKIELDDLNDINELVNEEHIKRAVRNAIDTLPSTKLNEIINEELTKIIREKLSSSKIVISTENPKH